MSEYDHYLLFPMPPHTMDQFSAACNLANQNMFTTGNSDLILTMDDWERLAALVGTAHPGRIPRSFFGWNVQITPAGRCGFFRRTCPAAIPEPMPEKLGITTRIATPCRNECKSATTDDKSCSYSAI